MNTKTEVIGGSSLLAASTPAVLKAAQVPWYESMIWLSIMATFFGILGFLSIIHKIILIRKDLKWDGEERRKER